MNKIKIFFCLTIIYLFFCINTFALEFIKSEHNPLTINYIYDYSQSLQAHIYKDGNIYKGILTAKKTGQTNYSLVAIESVDGIAWTMKKEIIASPEMNLSNPRLFTDKNGNKKILFVKIEQTNIYQIYFLDCDSDLNCSQNPQLLLAVNSGDFTENKGVFAPFITYIDGVYYFFYGAWGNTGFSTKLATSLDLINWTKCANPIGLGIDGGFIDFDENYINLIVHRADASGLQLYQTDKNLSCNSSWTNKGYILVRSQNYDQNHMFYPSMIKDSLNNKLYYSCRNILNVNNLCLAESPGIILTITPTIPLPTPTSGQTPIIIIPGFLASWNSNALLHNQNVNQTDWKLAPFINEYKGLINTLLNLDYIENKNIFIFSYDWRKNLDSLTDDLNKYLVQLQFNKYNIIGHSLGGLIGRIYAQKYGIGNINKLITIGSPHKGQAESYKAIEGGELSRSNSFQWLAQKIVLQISKDGFMTDKQIINDKMPIIKDLLPTYNFLINSSGQVIEISNMSIKNNYLINKNNSMDTNIHNILSVFAGQGNSNTVYGYEVNPANGLDKIFNYYTDGRPVKTFVNSGDGIVLTSSSSIIDNPILFNLNHGELIYKYDPIKTILKELNINYDVSAITEGKGTIISPSLIFLIKSSVAMEVLNNDKSYKEFDGIIFIENAASGEYELKITGITKGDYQVIIGALSEENESWNNIYGSITAEIPSSQTDIYEINFDQNKVKKQFVDNKNPVKLINELQKYLKITDHLKYAQIISKLNNCRRLYQTDNLEDLKLSLNEIMQNNNIISNPIAQEKIDNIFNIIFFSNK